MKTTFKKVLSILSITALVAANSTFAVNAGLTVASTTYNDGTDTITVTVTWKDFTSDNVSTLVLKTSGWVAVANVDVADVTEANGSFDVTDATNLDWLAAGNYSVSFITVAWDFGAAMVHVGNANDVTVSATVAPTLSMSLNSQSVTFGVLNPTGDNASTTDTQVTLSTNARSGLAVSAASIGADSSTTTNALGMAGTTNVIAWLASETNPAAFVDSTEYFGATLAVNAPTAWAALVANNNFSSANNGTADRANAVDGTLATTTGPTDAARLDVTYHAWITNVTAAWSYSSTVTYTVTGNF